MPLLSIFFTVFFSFQIKNISKLAEVSKNNALQLREKLGNTRNQSDSEEEKLNLFIKKVKNFLLGNLKKYIRTSFCFFPFFNI